MDAYRHRITIRGGPIEALRAAFGDFYIEPRGADTVLIGELNHSRMRDVAWRAKALGLVIVDLSVQDEVLGRSAGQAETTAKRPAAPLNRDEDDESALPRSASFERCSQRRQSGDRRRTHGTVDGRS